MIKTRQRTTSASPFALSISLTILVAIAFGDHVAHGQLTDENQAAFLQTLNEAMPLSDPAKKIRDGEIDIQKLASIELILANTTEVAIHQMRGGTNNKVYLHSDGHREAVYDSEGVLVNDGINDASANYFHPADDCLRHFTFDMAPWLLMGRSRKDPTSKDERIRAYVADLRVGIIKAQSVGRSDSDDYKLDMNKRGTVEALAFFLLVVERGEASELFDIVNSKNPASAEAIDRLTENLEAGLQKVFEVNQGR